MNDLLPSRLFLHTIALVLSSLALALPLSAESFFLDAIVASIDDKPITLSEVAKRMNPPQKLTLAAAKEDPAFGRALDIVILDHLVELEAVQRKVSVFEEEVNEYLKEIAKRNNLTQEEFIQALKRENRTEADYRQQVKGDILRSKLASSLSRGSAAISDTEVDQEIKKQHGTSTSGRMVTLRQILISTSQHSEESAEQAIKGIQERLAAGDKFDDLAREFSESPEKSDGGSLGTLAENDLAAEILDGINSLDVGDVSEIIHSAQGFHLFLLEDRTEAEEEEQEEKTVTAEEREQIRAQLKQQKLENKMTEFFTTELYKLHSVDKKI